MKHFHQNLLILLALSLCGLCLFQWHSQTRQRNRMGDLNQLLAGKSTAIQGYTNSLATLNHQVEQMDGTITALRAAAAAQEETNAAQKRELARRQLLNEGMTSEIKQYTNAVTTLEAKLQELADGIKKQNAAITELAAQRDEFIHRLNDSVKDRNAIVEKYNELVKQIDKSAGTGNKEH